MGVRVLSHRRCKVRAEQQWVGAAPAILTQLQNHRVALIPRGQLTAPRPGVLGRASLYPYTTQHPEEYFNSEVPWHEVSAKSPQQRAPRRSWGSAAWNPCFCWDVPGSITIFPHQVIMLKCCFAFTSASFFLILICNILFILLLAIRFPTKHCLSANQAGGVNRALENKKSSQWKSRKP